MESKSKRRPPDEPVIGPWPPPDVKRPRVRCKHDAETSVHERGRHLYVCQSCGRRREAR